jgi:hypothetical protein
MNRIVVAFVFLWGNVCLAQSDKPKLELFTSYLGRTILPSQAYIPAQTCGAIISQADRIVSSDGLKALPNTDLLVASLNLRTCATSKLARFDRDLAVGLYGEVRYELNRRERNVEVAK